VKWSIYYADGSHWAGESETDWYLAPDGGVQVIVGPPGYWGGGGWIGVTDRSLWTGEDEYDPFGFGVKRGSVVPDDDYWKIWVLAAYDGNPPESERLHPMKRA
jgi:hypothetical protein